MPHRFCGSGGWPLAPNRQSMVSFASTKRNNTSISVHKKKPPANVCLSLCHAIFSHFLIKNGEVSSTETHVVAKKGFHNGFGFGDFRICTPRTGGGGWVGRGPIHDPLRSLGGGGKVRSTIHGVPSPLNAQVDHPQKSCTFLVNIQEIPMQTDRRWETNDGDERGGGGGWWGCPHASGLVPIEDTVNKVHWGGISSKCVHSHWRLCTHSFWA